MEVLRERVSVLNEIVEYRGVYYSNEWIRKNILQQTDEEIEEEDKKIKEEIPEEQFDKILGNEQPEPEAPEFGEEGEEGGGNPFGGGNPKPSPKPNDDDKDNDGKVKKPKPPVKPNEK